MLYIYYKEKLWYNAGNKILIKTVAQAVPTYTMSIFQLPNALCDEMTSMPGSFGGGKLVRGIKWLV